ncbi:hypothetical protein D3C75_529810 [compost metagenome]
MAGMHNRLRAMVIRQLALQPKGKGVAVTFHQQSGGGYNPATGGTYPIVVNDFVGSGIRVNYSEFAYKNNAVEYGDFQIYLSPVQADGTEMPTPNIGDEFTFIDKKARVVNFSPFNENSIGCGWKLQVRYG